MNSHITPKLSIITINLNNAEGLRKTIESVINQTFTGYEYLIIDGGSTDGSIEIINEFAEATLPNGEKLYWLSEPDKGIYNAMNKGITKANGEYLQFLNSGDILVDNILFRVFNNTISEGIVFGDLLLTNGYVFDSLRYRSKISLYDLLDYGFPHQASFIKRSLFSSELYREDLQVVSDFYFFIKKIIIENVSLRYLGFPIVYYDVNGISSIKGSVDIHKKEKQMILEELLPARIMADYNDFLAMNKSPLKNYLPLLSTTTGFHRYVAFIVGIHVKLYAFIKGIKIG